MRSPASASAAAAASAAASSAAHDADLALAAASEIPVGGGAVFSTAKVVVTQPEAGQFRAFGAVCTHAQCLVDKVAMGRIGCPCHGSQFSVKDGSVLTGPAVTPLPAVKIAVKDGKISLA